MNEFELIKHYFADLASAGQGVVLGIGDDAAVLRPPRGVDLVMAMDVLNAGVHFPNDALAEDIGHKALAVNLSDLAAMGATPLWFTLGLSLPDSDPEWLEALCRGIGTLAGEASIALVGGDTTRGPLSLAVNVCGFVPKGSAIPRSGAKPGDVIVLTGGVGGAALGLAVARRDAAVADFDAAERASVLEALNRPQPALAAGAALRGFATAALDVSDGLAQDLGHLLAASEVGALVDLDAIVLHPVYARRLRQFGFADALGFGDDYVLCATVPPTLLQEARAALRKAGAAPLAVIGQIQVETGLRFSSRQGYVSGLDMAQSGFDHFRT